MASFVLNREIAASPERVFDTITDHRRYLEFTPIRRAELEVEGSPEPNGKGAVRALHVVGPPIRERVIAYERPHLFTYELVSGLPLRDHIGTVELGDSLGGTAMTYAVQTTPTIPVVGFVVVEAMKLALSRLMAAVAADAEEREVAGD